MPEIMALVCPVCGAPLSPGATHCAFCGSAIYIKADAPQLNLENLNQAVIQEHIADFRARIRKDRYDVEAHYGLGMAYYSLGLTDEAIEELTHAAKLMPENADIQTQLAVVLHHAVLAGKKSAEGPMKERLAKALLLDPTNFEANLLRADVLQRRGDYEGALDVLQPVIAEDPARGNAKRIEIIEAGGKHAAEIGDTVAFNRAVQQLRVSGHEDLARNLLIASIQRNTGLLDEAAVRAAAQRRDDGGRGSSGSARAPVREIRSRDKAVLVGVCYFFLGFLVYGMILQLLPTDADGKTTGVASGISGILGLAWVIVPFVAGWRYRRGYGLLGASSVRQLFAKLTSRQPHPVSPDPVPGRVQTTEDLISIERQLSARARAQQASAIEPQAVPSAPAAQGPQGHWFDSNR